MNSLSQIDKIRKMKAAFTPSESDREEVARMSRESAFRTVYMFRNIHTGEEREFSADWYHADWRLVEAYRVLKHR